LVSLVRGKRPISLIGSSGQNSAALRREREQYLAHSLNQGKSRQYVRVIATRLLDINRMRVPSDQNGESLDTHSWLAPVNRGSAERSHQTFMRLQFFFKRILNRFMRYVLSDTFAARLAGPLPEAVG